MSNDPDKPQPQTSDDKAKQPADDTARSRKSDASTGPTKLPAFDERRLRARGVRRPADDLVGALRDCDDKVAETCAAVLRARNEGFEARVLAADAFKDTTKLRVDDLIA